MALLRYVTLLCGVLTVSACTRTAPEPPQTAGRPAPPPVDVTVLTLAEQPIPQTSDFIATVHSLRSVTVQPQVEGIIRQIFVRAGERVTAGQPLVQIDPDKQRATLSATESQRSAREADLAFTTQQLARLRKLFEAGAVSQAEVEQAENARAVAEAQLAALASQILEAQVQLAYFRVTAPTDGIVGDLSVRAGDRVTPSTAITGIDQNSGLELYINVPLERAADLRLGLPVELVDADGTVLASNPVSFIAPRADDATQSVLVKASLRAPPPGIRIMQYVRTRIVWSTAPRLTIPVIAVNRLGGQYFVFLAEQGPQGFVARQTPISLDELVGNQYIVRSGVRPGDRVIVSNIQKLGDGAPVTPVA